MLVLKDEVFEEFDLRKFILDNATYKIVNKEKNAGILAEAPHKDILDLAAVYEICAREDERQNMPERAERTTYSFMVTNVMCEAARIKIDELDHVARENTRKAGFSVLAIDSFLKEMTGTDMQLGQENAVYVCTNTDSMHGASILMFPERFAEIAEKLDDDLYILPSSIHEVIAIRARSDIPGELRKMVSEINDAIVQDEEVLGNSIYRYSRATGQISIVE